jgi:predicted house-cleaning NTP pyrophosphatase (Maf/HAM1 superfamily)
MLDNHIEFGKLSDEFINSYTDVTGCVENTGEYCIMKDGKNILIT